MANNVTANPGSGGATFKTTDNAGVHTPHSNIDSMPALAAGSNNIGDVDVASVPAPLSTTGGGTEADALRVTIATDSTGVLSVDDNGASLTVDGSVSIAAAIPAGTNNIGDVDVLTLPALPAGNNNIGDVDVASLPAGSVAATTAKTLDYDSGAGTDTVPAFGVLLPASGGAVAGGTSTNPLRTDPTGTTTQPVSAASLPLPSGAATSAKQDTIIGHVDGIETLLSGGLPAALGANGGLVIEGVASGTVVPVADGGGSLTVDGTVTIQDGGNVISIDDASGSLTVDGTVTASNATGNVAHDAADSGNPVKVGARARSTEPAAVASDDRADLIADLTGKLVTKPYAIPELTLAGNPSVITDTTSTSVIAAQGSGVRIYVTSLVITNSDATVGTLVSIKDGSGGTTLFQAYCAAAGGGVAITFPVPLRLTANTALHAVCGTTSAEVYVSAQGYSGA